MEWKKERGECSRQMGGVAVGGLQSSLFVFVFAEYLHISRNQPHATTVGTSQRSRLDGCHASQLALVVPELAQNFV